METIQSLTLKILDLLINRITISEDHSSMLYLIYFKRTFFGLEVLVSMASLYRSSISGLVLGSFKKENT